MENPSDFEENYEYEDETKQPSRRQIALSNEEKRKIKETLVEMEKNQVQPQSSVGRKFDGPGFASKPNKIVYKDFEIGVPMSIAVELTNISYSFNSFKLLPLDDEIIDFIEIDYRPCGRIPAGISTIMTLKFTPMVNKDYFSNLKLLSETGLVLVPIECLCKKCIITIKNPIIDYEEVILGQEIHKHLTVENSGALQCKYYILDEEKDLLIEPREEVEKEAEENSKDNDINPGYKDFVERKVIINKDNLILEIKDGDDELKRKRTMRSYFLKQMSYPAKGIFEAYSTKNLTLILNSKFVGIYEIKVLLKVEYAGGIEFKDFIIKFSVVDLPVYSEKKIYELNYLIEENAFREKVILYNKSNISYKLQVYNHKEVNEFIELNPNLGYIQANSSFEIWIKLKIFKSIFNLNKFFTAVDPKESEFNIPLKIVLTNINIPLIVILHFFVTTDKILFSKTFLNYDKCFIDESTKMEIGLENTSLLPMKYGFIMLPKEFTAKNNIDFLLSNEKASIDLAYENHDNYLGHREGDLFCRVVTNELTVQNVKIKYHIELLNPYVEIHPKKIIFPAIPVKEKTNCRLVIQNKTSNDYVCEWLTPPFSISGLIIMPKVFALPSNQYITCVIEYNSEFRPYGPFSGEQLEKELGYSLITDMKADTKSPPASLSPKLTLASILLEDKIKKEIEKTLSMSPDTQDKKKKQNQGSKQTEMKKEAQPKKLDPKKDKKLIEEEERKKKEEEERKEREIEEKRAKRIQEFNKDKELRLFGAENYYYNDNDGQSDHWKFVIPLYYKMEGQNDSIEPKATFIEVNTTCVEKYLLFDYGECDFGEVSVQTRKTMNISLHNKSEHLVEIKMKPLIISNCFQVVNSVRSIDPKSSYNFIVEFYPMKDLPYFDEFCVYTEDTQSTIKLKGLGVRPEIEVSVNNGIFFLGNVCVNNPIEKTFEIFNRSSFNVNYEIKIPKSGKKNKNGLKPFCFIPYKSEIAANSKITVRAIFSGDHQDFENFSEYILIHVPNQKKPNYIFVSAACWLRQAYWREFFTPSFPDETWLKKNIEQDYFVDCLRLKSISPCSNNDKIFLTFSKIENPDTATSEEIEKSLKRKIILGNCKLADNKLEKNMTYEITLQKDDVYFSCDLPKGSVNPGFESVISFIFKKPPKDPLLKDIECLTNIGMWITSRAELKVSGGFVQPGSPDVVIVEILLKAYVEQI